MHECDGVGDIEAFFRHVRGTTEADPPIKGLAKIPHPPTSDHGAGNVRPTDRSSVRLGEHRVHGDRNAVPIKHLDDAHGARYAAGLQLQQRRTHGVLIGEVEAEEV